MEINWTTFTAQIINFLILAWLLKRFLYGPIVRAMEDREKKIADQQDEVIFARQNAEQEAAEYRKRKEELDHTFEELFAKAGYEVEQWKEKHLQQAREEVDQARKEWYRSIERERNTFLHDLRQRAGQQVYSMTRRILTKLCQASLERQIIEAFAERLQQIHEGKRNEIVAAIHNSHDRLLIETAFSLTDEDARKIESIIHEYLTDEIEIDFKVVPELICGIEMKTAGFKIAWSVDETLEELEGEFSTALDAAISKGRE